MEENLPKKMTKFKNLKKYWAILVKVLAKLVSVGKYRKNKIALFRRNTHQTNQSQNENFYLHIKDL